MRFLTIVLIYLFVSLGFFCPLAAKKGRKNANSNEHGKDLPARKAPASNTVKIKSGMSFEEKKDFDFQMKCKTAVPNNFSPAQAEKFCSAVNNQESLSCVKDSRSGSVKLSFDEIVSLCQGIGYYIDKLQ